MTQPLPKRRKLGENGDTSSLDQQSFAAVLEQLEAEDDGSGGESQLSDTNTDIQSLLRRPTRGLVRRSRL